MTDYLNAIIWGIIYVTFVSWFSVFIMMYSNTGTAVVVTHVVGFASFVVVWMLGEKINFSAMYRIWMLRK